MLLLQAYNVSPPPRYTGSEPPGIRDSVATCVLQLYHPCFLLSSILLSVAGDGNCLFRALSRGLYAVARTTTFICAYSRLWRLLHTGNGTTLRPFIQGVTQGPSHSMRHLPRIARGLFSSVDTGQYSETMTQLAKFSGPTAANGRHYRQRHADSGRTLGRLNYHQVNTVTSGRRQNDVALVGNTSASVADVAATSRRRHCATEPTS